MMKDTVTNDMNTVLADRVQRIKPSATLAVSARAEELQAAGKHIINLGIGEPDFDTPKHIKDAAIQAIHDGHTKYTPADGTKSFKIAIKNKLLRENKLSYELNQIIVSGGAKHSIFNLLSAVINPGDEVIIPAPYWVSYPDMVKLTDGTPVFVNCTAKTNFKLTAELLESAITPKTKLLILNSPSNPTGKNYTADELREVGKVLAKYPHVLIASDDIYEHHGWNNMPFTSILNVCPDLYDRTIVINSVSKTYAMTGWRIGYAAGPAKIIGAMKKAQSQNTSSPNSIAQYAAEAALNGDQQCVADMTKAYKERHDYVYSELKTMPGIDCQPSDGTFYIFPSIAGLLNSTTGITTDLEFSEYLLNEAELAVIPGSAFGAPGYIRICFTTNMNNLTIAMKRLRDCITKLTNTR